LVHGLACHACGSETARRIDPQSCDEGAYHGGYDCGTVRLFEQGARGLVFCGAGSTYRRLVEHGGDDEGVWSIACFFLVRRLRGQGVSQRIIAAALRSWKRTLSIRVLRAIASWASFQCLRPLAFEKWIVVEAVDMPSS